jgi:hypothetical protein
MDIAEVPVHNFVCACFAIPGQLTGTFDCDWISNCDSCAVVGAGATTDAVHTGEVDQAMTM